MVEDGEGEEDEEEDGGKRRRAVKRKERPEGGGSLGPLFGGKEEKELVDSKVYWHVIPTIVLQERMDMDILPPDVRKGYQEELQRRIKLGLT